MFILCVRAPYTQDVVSLFLRLPSFMAQTSRGEWLKALKAIFRKCLENIKDK